MDVYLFMFFLSLWGGYQSNLEEMQAVLNSTEVSLHHLTALVDCRSLHMVRVYLWKILEFVNVFKLPSKFCVITA